MGHVTALGATPEQAVERALRARAAVARRPLSSPPQAPGR
jgi:hypothetical protein